MNNYNENMACCPTPMENTPIEPMNAIVDGIVITTERALEMIYRINLHLFGLGEPPKEETINPKCFRDVMTKQRADMNELCVELDRLINMLGV